MKKGVLVLGHGSKAREADEILARITGMVKEKGSYEVIGMASLQFSSPSLEEGIADMAEKGVQHVIIVPMFIFEGNHVKEDIPEAIKNIEARYPGMKMSLARHMGADSRIADILVDRIKDAEEDV